MADFDTAIEFVLANEGGLEIDPEDPGGITNFGISQRSYPAVDIRNLTRDAAKAIYLRDFWLFGGVSDQHVATKILDAYVNSKHHAIRVLQLSLGSIEAGPIVADGNWGPLTEAHVNAADADALLAEFKARLCKMHCDDAIANPGQQKDLLGWIRRDLRG